jgi:hypothetical protein
LEKPKLENFHLLLQFMKGDRRIPDADRWCFSIDNKIMAMEILYREVLVQIPKCSCELKEAEEKGQGSYIECIILAVKYEVFLNSIYSFCENLSNVVSYLHTSQKLPTHFRKQKSRLLKDPSLYSEYAEILRTTKWYDEIHAMRSEATHYLSGLIVISSPANLGYVNVPKGTKKGTPANISIADVKKHVEQIHSEVFTFLDLFGNHFIKIIDHDTKVTLVCQNASGQIVGARNISLKEYFDNKAGVCLKLKTKNDCPEKHSCEAYNKVKG